MGVVLLMSEVDIFFFKRKTAYERRISDWSSDVCSSDLEVFDAGALGRKVRIFRLPEDNPHRKMTLERRIALKDRGDNPIFVRVTQEDGHIAWSSPIYFFR